MALTLTPQGLMKPYFLLHDGAGAFGDKVMSHIDVSRTSVPISLGKKK